MSRPEPPWEEIDSGIVAPVRCLHSAGLHTFASCQGGSGHDFTDPTVLLEGATEVRRAAVTALESAGFSGFYSAVYYSHGCKGDPFVEISFWSSACAECPGHGHTLQTTGRS